MRSKQIILLFLLLICIFLNANAQRYLNKIFDSVTVESSVIYGVNKNVNGIMDTLPMAIYQPKNDTATKRPLIILAHGGFFLGGSYLASDVSYLCNAFALRGYVCVSIEYRVGIGLSGHSIQYEYANAAWRATQDFKAAVRFFRKDLASNNLYKIDEKFIYAGGVSAGAISALHVAFCDLPEEVATNLEIDTLANGGIEGNTGNSGYASKVRGVLSLSGAISDVRWMNNNKNVSLFLMHGSNDATVPYGTNYYILFGQKIALLQGGFSTDSAAKINGMRSTLYPFYGAGHVPFSALDNTGKKYMDTTETQMCLFLFNDLNRSTFAVNEYSNDLKDFVKIYPIPSSETIFIEIGKGKKSKIKLVDFTGKVVRDFEAESNFLKIEKNELSSGIYFLNIENEYGSFASKVVFD